MKARQVQRRRRRRCQSRAPATQHRGQAYERYGVERERCAELRFEHATARAAYPRDPHRMRTRLRTRLPAHERVCARRRCDFLLGECRTPPLTREGVRSRAYGPAQPVDGSRPHRRARWIFQSGKSAVASQGVPAHARPHARASGRRALVPTQHTDTCLRSRCAGEAALIETAATTASAGVVSAVTAAAAPPPVAARCHSCARSRLRRCLPSQGHGSDPKGRIARTLDVLSLAVTVGVRGWLAGRREAHSHALGHVCVPLVPPWCSRLPGMP